MTEYLTTKSLALELKVSERTVMRWIKTGALKSYKIGRLVRISRKELNNFLNPATTIARTYNKLQEFLGGELRIPEKPSKIKSGL